MNNDAYIIVNGTMKFTTNQITGKPKNMELLNDKYQNNNENWSIWT